MDTKFSELVANVSKVTLIPLLALWLLTNRKNNPGENWLLAAFFFSWVGDLFLIFKSLESQYFIAGMISFLVAQLVLAKLFYNQLKPTVSPIKIVGFAIPILLYAGYFLSNFYLQEEVDAFKTPVTAYVIGISIMAIMALSRGFTQTPSIPKIKWVAAGGVLFLISDSLIAYHAFFEEVPHIGGAIMATYLGAQVCFAYTFKTEA